MKKSRLLMSILTATIATTALTACNGGGGANNRTVSAVKAKSISAAELEVLHERIKQIDTLNKNPQDLKSLIQDFNLLKDYPESVELQAIYQDIADAILEDKFGEDPAVLTTLATSLGTMNITDPEIQDIIIQSIFLDVFGKDPAVLTALATSIGTMNITSVDVLNNLLAIIRYFKFGKDPATLTALAKSIGAMNITNNEVQLNLIRIIRQDFFGKDPATLTALAKSIGAMNITDAEVQLNLIRIVSQDFFGKDPATLTAITTTLFTMNITNPDVQEELSRLILRSKLDTNLQDLPNYMKYILSNTFAQGDTFKTVPGLRNYHFFGGMARSNLASEVESEEAQNDGNINGVSHVGQAILQTVGNNKLGNYGFVYTKKGEPDLLMVFTANEAVSKEMIEGFFNMGRNTRLIYGEIAQYVKAYKIVTDPTGTMRYPDITQEVSDKRLPKWLRNLKVINKFDVTNYKESELISFALSFTERISDPKLKALTVSVIHHTIVSHGECVMLGSTQAENSSIKNKINAALSPDYDANGWTDLEILQPKLDNFWDTLPDLATKAKLVFLLGQIAKKGGLGYEDNKTNQANDLYYTLTRYYARKLEEEYPQGQEEYEAVKELNRLLEERTCIEVVTTDFMINTPQLHLFDVWALKVS